MSELSITARCKIHDGKLEEFKRIGAACIETVIAKDSGTLRYDWFIDESKMECCVLEKYTSSETLMEHMGNLGDKLPGLMNTCTISLEIFGSPSQQVTDAVGGLTTGVYSHYNGI